MSTYKGFSQVQLKRPKRSKFDLSHEKRLSTRMGRLTPILCTETMPNDSFRVNSEVMLRLAPLLAPLMHRVNVFVHFFFIPNRILWSDWELFITNGRLGTETPPIPPVADIGGLLAAGSDFLDEGSVADYLGIRPIPDADTALWVDKDIALLPFAACYKVWYDYYRDRNYTADNTVLPLASGTISTGSTLTALLTTRLRAYQHDYFTSALPWTQRGDEVLMPLIGTGDVSYLDTSLVKESDGDPPAAASNLLASTAGGGTLGSRTDLTSLVNTQNMRIENIDEVTIDNSEVSINDFRTAIQLQSWLERNALAGSRYNESILAHFGRKTSDGRLQRAEYLGGGKVTVKISEVVTTAFSEDGAANNVPAGNMAGHGLTFGNTNRFTYNCEEHGFVVGFMSVMPTTGYMQGWPRMFRSRQTFLDYPWPSFAHLGEQPVHTWELYADSNTVADLPEDDTLFGYQSRYSDWKYIPSSAHGNFRSDLDFWHLTRKFSSAPVLGNTFVEFEDTLQDRVFAVSEVDTLWCYLYNQISVVRALPYFGKPATLA